MESSLVGFTQLDFLRSKENFRLGLEFVSSMWAFEEACCFETFSFWMKIYGSPGFSRTISPAWTIPGVIPCPIRPKCGLRGNYQNRENLPRRRWTRRRQIREFRNQIQSQIMENKEESQPEPAPVPPTPPPAAAVQPTAPAATTEPKPTPPDPTPPAAPAPATTAASSSPETEKKELFADLKYYISGTLSDEVRKKFSELKNHLTPIF